MAAITRFFVFADGDDGGGGEPGDGGGDGVNHEPGGVVGDGEVD